MSMHVNDGQRTPYNPNIWDQYDTHPGHPEPEPIAECAGNVAVDTVVEDVVFDYYSGCASNQLPASSTDGNQTRVVRQEPVLLNYNPDRQTYRTSELFAEMEWSQRDE